LKDLTYGIYQEETIPGKNGKQSFAIS